jgi:hypothetical protein
MKAFYLSKDAYQAVKVVEGEIEVIAGKSAFDAKIKPVNQGNQALVYCKALYQVSNPSLGLPLSLNEPALKMEYSAKSRKIQILGVTT